MKKASILAAVAAFCIAPGASAQQQSRAPFIYGVKVGFMQPDGDGNSSATSLGGVMGQQLARNVSWEGEFTVTLADGEVGGDEDWDITTLGGYAVYRSSGKTSFKAKTGLAWWDAGDDDDISLSLGIGVGVPVRKGTLDIEFTEIDDGVDFISVGYVLRVD